MKPTIYRLTLDVQNPVSQFTISTKKGDSLRRLIIDFTEGGEPYHLLEGCSAILGVKRPNGEIALDGCAVQGDRVIYDFTRCVTRLAGRHECEVSLYDRDDMQLTAPKFDIVTFSGVGSDEESEADERYITLTEAVREAEYLKKAAESLEENLERIETVTSFAESWEGNKHTTSEVTLCREDWSDNSITVNVPGVYEDNSILVSPTSESREMYLNCGAYCAEQSLNQLIFKCDILPSEDIKVNVMMFGEETEGGEAEV